MDNKLSLTATAEVAEGVAKRLEKELIGAWRAGYDYLYVAPDITHREPQDRSELSVNITYKVLPLNHELQHNPFDVPMERYDLDSLTTEEYNEYY